MAATPGRDAVYQVDAEDIGAFVKALRRHTDARSLDRELKAGLAKASTGLHHDLTEAIPHALPRKGGLGGLIQSEAKWTTVVRSGRWEGLWVRAVAKSSATKKYRDLKALLVAGAFRHPLYGNKSKWFFQNEGTNPALIRRTITDAAPDLRLSALEVMESIAQKIVKETN